MKKTTLAALAVFALCTGALFTWRNIAYAQRKIPPGLEPYTPTRIEWLIVELQANYRVELSSETGYSLDYVSPDNVTVLILVQHTPDADRRIINMAVDTARRLVEMDLKSRGWQNWVRLREDIRMSKPER